MEFPAFVSALKAFYQDNDQPLRLKPKTTQADIAAAEQELGFEIDPALKAAWLAANGGPSYKPVFARQGYLTGYDFLPLQDALKQWRGLRTRAALCRLRAAHAARPADPGRLVPGRLAALRRVSAPTLMLMLDHTPTAQGRRGRSSPSRTIRIPSTTCAWTSPLLAQTLEQIEEDPEDFLEG